MVKLILFSVTLVMSLNASATWSIMDEKNKDDEHIAKLNAALSEAIENRDFIKYSEAFEKLLDNSIKFFKIHYSEESLANTQMTDAYYSLSTDAAPKNGAELCAMIDKPYGVNQFLANRNNRMAFTNQAGTFGTGTCWWHSSLTRSAAMLAIYHPAKEKPSETQAGIILDLLIGMDGVVAIPGFANWYEFSAHFDKLIESKLTAWQIREGVSFAWTRGLKGTSTNNSKDLRENLDRAELEFRLYRKPVYMMLQYPGVSAHAWLILDIKKTDTGYTLFILDSNLNTVDRWDYRWDMPNLNYVGDGRNFIPYIQPKERHDLFKLKASTDKFCKPYRK